MITTDHAPAQESVGEDPFAPFVRLLAITDALPPEYMPNDETPLRDVTPGIWPTLGELRQLVHALEGRTPAARADVEAQLEAVRKAVGDFAKMTGGDLAAAVDLISMRCAASERGAPPAQASVEAVLYARFDPAWGRMMLCERGQFGAVEYRPASPPSTVGAEDEACRGWAAVYDGRIKSCHESRDECVAAAEHHQAIHPVYLGPAWRHQED